MCRNVKCLPQVYSHTQQCSNSMMTNIDGQDIFASKEVKCLGYWLSWDLSAKKAIDEAIAKSRRAFFMHRSQVFEGNLNPLSGRSLFEVCVVPILLYGCENWQLTSTLICQLLSLRRIFSSVYCPRVKLKKLCISLIRSKLLYCSLIWRPNFLTDITSLDNAQRRATKFILNNYDSNYHL